MLNEPIVGLRIRGKIHETGKWTNITDYVDIDISKEEAERIVKFLSDILKSAN